MSADINVPLLRKVMDHIESHPEEWKQSLWVSGMKIVEYGCGEVDTWAMHDLPEAVATPPSYCGTAFCFAGHVAHTEGWLAIWKGTNFDHHRMQHEDGTVDFVQDIARDALGLSESQAAMLFDANNELDELRQMVDYLVSQAE